MDTVQTITQAGAVGISIALIWLIYKLITNHDSHLLDSLNRNTDAFVKNAEALTKLSDKIESLK